MNFFQNLQMREKTLVIGAAVAVILALLYTLVIDPVLAHSSRLDRQIRKAQQDLQMLQTHRREYLQQKCVLDNINAQLKQKQGPAIRSQLSALANRVGTKVSSMKTIRSVPSDAYTEKSVEIRMDDVTLEKLTKYLYEIEQSPQYLRIKRLRIKPRLNDRQLLTVTFRVSTFTPKEDAT